MSLIVFFSPWSYGDTIGALRSAQSLKRSGHKVYLGVTLARKGKRWRRHAGREERQERRT